MTARELYEAHHAALVPEAGGTLPFVRWEALTPREKAGWEYAATVVVGIHVAKAEALQAEAAFFETDMAKTWGQEARWLTTGTRVAALVASILRERATDLLNGEAS